METVSHNNHPPHWTLCFFDVPYSLWSIGAAEADSWQGLYWVVCHCLPSVVFPCSVLINAESRERKQHVPFKKKSLVWSTQGLFEPPTDLPDSDSHSKHHTTKLWHILNNQLFFFYLLPCDTYCEITPHLVVFVEKKLSHQAKNQLFAPQRGAQRHTIPAG